jgi:hypothetical protein
MSLPVTYLTPFLMLLGLVPAAVAGEKMVQKVYAVADLVVPVEGLPGLTTTKPETPAATGLDCMLGCRQAPKMQTLHENLINLVTRMVKPESWADAGGRATIDYFPLGMGLVVRQSAEGHEEIASLLNSLRRLQDAQVCVEMRLVSMPDCERIGVDFNCTEMPQGCLTIGVGVSSNSGLIGSVVLNERNFDTKCTPACFAEFLKGHAFRGAAQEFTLTPGQVVSSPATDATKPAFLNDKQVAAYLESVQGDRRASVMMAPKLTCMNGQNARVETGSTQTFVTGVSAEQRNGRTVMVPKNESFYIGTRFEVRPVISADRKFVALKLTGECADLAGVAEMVPVTTLVAPEFEGGAQGQPVPFTQIVQKPRVERLTFDKSAILPDGATMAISLGKVTRETRVETACPVLSKTPYISRLFKNVRLDHETHNVVLLVTARVIVEEQEEAQQPGGVGSCIGALIGPTKGGVVCGTDSDCPKCVTKAAPCCTSAAKSAMMGLADVVALAGSGVNDEVILNQMRTTGASFALGTEDLIFLKKNKVSDAVVMEMQNSRMNRMGPATMPAPPYYYHPPYPAVLPYPGPPMSVAPIPAYAPPAPPAYSMPPSQCVPTPGGPNCLPTPVRGMSISPASYSTPLPLPAQAANEGAAAVGEMLIEAAVELIEGFGELFGAD